MSTVLNPLLQLVAVAGPAAGPAEDAEPAVQTEFDVILKSAGQSKLGCS
jgi:ribosomal protein L7/L12